MNITDAIHSRLEHVGVYRDDLVVLLIREVRAATSVNTYAGFDAMRSAVSQRFLNYVRDTFPEGEVSDHVQVASVVVNMAMDTLEGNFRGT